MHTGILHLVVKDIGTTVENLDLTGMQVCVCVCVRVRGKLSCNLKILKGSAQRFQRRLTKFNLSASLHDHCSFMVKDSCKCFAASVETPDSSLGGFCAT